MSYGFISILADGSEAIPAGYEVMTLARATELQVELAAEVTSVEGTWGIIAIQFPIISIIAVNSNNYYKFR